MRAFAVLALLALAGCGDKKEAPRSSGGRGAAGLALDAPRTYKLTDSVVAVDVTLRPPSGWQDESTADAIVLGLPGGTRLEVELTCHGECGDLPQLAANVATKAKTRFDDEASATWDQPVTEAAPGVYRYAFHAGADHLVGVERLIAGRILDCNARLVGDDATFMAELVRQCDELVAVTATAPSTPTAAPDAGAPATPPDATPAAPPPVTLTYVTPKAADHWTDQEDMVMLLDNGALKVTNHVVKEVEVLDATDKAVTRAKHTYREVQGRFEQGTQVNADPSPLTGKTYLLDATTGGIKVTAADGSPVAAAEVDAVLNEEEQFGQGDGIERLICSQAYQKGQPITLPPPALLAAQPLDDTPITEMTLTLVEVAGGVASFDVAMRAESGLAQATDMSLKGKMRLDLATGTALELAVEGPATVSGKRGTVKLDLKRTP